MAEIRYHDALAGMLYHDFGAFRLVSSTASQIIVSDGRGYHEIYRGSFTYDSEDYPHGTVTSLEGTLDGRTVFSIADVSQDAFELAVAIENGDTEEIFDRLRSGNDRIFGSRLDEELFGLEGNDLIYAGGGNDFMHGGDGRDTLMGGDGNDVILVSRGFDTIDGGAGRDNAYFEYELNSVKVRFDGDKVIVTHPDGTATLTNVETFEFRSDIYTLAELRAMPTVRGRDIIGTEDNDTLAGAAGNDTIEGYAGDDVLRGNAGNDRLYGHSGNDVLNGGAGDDLLDGGDGNDTAEFFGNIDTTVFLGITMPQNTGHGRDTLIGIENVSSGAGDDKLSGNAAANILSGNLGNDTLHGFNGADLLIGGAGDDSLVGGYGNDTLNGGGGADVLDGGVGNDTVVYGGTLRAVVNLNYTGPQATWHGMDRLISIENVTGGAAGDALTGNGVANRLNGEGGDDLVRGMAGSDTLSGGTGDDTLEGGFGFDVLTGGDGADMFVFNVNNNTDRITDFDIGEDMILINGAQFDDLLIHTVNGAAAVDFSGTRILLDGVDADVLRESDFLFA